MISLTSKYKSIGITSSTSRLVWGRERGATKNSHLVHGRLDANRAKLGQSPNKAKPKMLKPKIPRLVFGNLEKQKTMTTIKRKGWCLVLKSFCLRTKRKTKDASRPTNSKQANHLQAEKNLMVGIDKGTISHFNVIFTIWIIYAYDMWIVVQRALFLSTPWYFHIPFIPPRNSCPYYIAP